MDTKMTKSQLIKLILDPVGEVEAYRQKHGLRIEDLAYEARVPASTYRSVVNGQTGSPRLELLRAISVWLMEKRR